MMNIMEPSIKPKDLEMDYRNPSDFLFGSLMVVDLGMGLEIPSLHVKLVGTLILPPSLHIVQWCGAPFY